MQKSGESARRYLLAKRDKYKQNNYVIYLIMATGCHKLPLRPPRDRVHLDDIKKSVAMKKDIKIFSGMLYCVEWVCDVSKTPHCFVKSRNPRPMTRRHIVDDLKSKEPL